MSRASTPEGLFFQPVGMEAFAQILQQVQQNMVEIRDEMHQRFDHLHGVVEGRAMGNVYGANVGFHPVAFPVMTFATPAPVNTADVMVPGGTPPNRKNRRPGKRERSKSKGVGAHAEQAVDQEINESQRQQSASGDEEVSKFQSHKALIVEGSSREEQVLVEDLCIEGGTPCIVQNGVDDAASSTAVPSTQDAPSESCASISKDTMLAFRWQVLATDQGEPGSPPFQSLPSWRAEMIQHGLSGVRSSISFVEQAEWDELYGHLPTEVTSKIGEIEWHNYKQRLCARHKRRECRYGRACSFAHGEQDLLQERTVANVEVVLHMILSQHCRSSPQTADAEVQALLQSIGVEVEEPGNVIELQQSTSHEPPEASPVIFPCAAQRAATALRRSSRSYSRARRVAQCLLPMPKTTRAELRASSRSNQKNRPPTGTAVANVAISMAQATEEQQVREAIFESLQVAGESTTKMLATTLPNLGSASSGSGLTAEERAVGIQKQREREALNSRGDELAQDD